MTRRVFFATAGKKVCSAEVGFWPPDQARPQILRLPLVFVNR